MLIDNGKYKKIKFPFIEQEDYIKHAENRLNRYNQ